MTSTMLTSSASNRSSRELTVADMVLVATAVAANWTTDPVRYETVVVHAWRVFPAQFCLDGYPEFPDASDIHKPLYRTLKDRGMVESLGQKTFRLTELGLTTARSIESDERAIAAWRKTIAVDVCNGQTTESALRKLLDDSGDDVGDVAMRLLTAVLTIRFPGNVQAQGSEKSDSIASVKVGDTLFSVLIPTTIERLRDWINEGALESRRALVVRDEILPQVGLILRQEEQSVPTASYGIVAFLGQMIESMSEYDEHRIAEVRQSVTERYNRLLPLGVPRIQFNAVEWTG